MQKLTVEMSLGKSWVQSVLCSTSTRVFFTHGYVNRSYNLACHIRATYHLKVFVCVYLMYNLRNCRTQRRHTFPYLQNDICIFLASHGGLYERVFVATTSEQTSIKR